MVFRYIHKCRSFHIRQWSAFEKQVYDFHRLRPCQFLVRLERKVFITGHNAGSFGKVDRLKCPVLACYIFETGFLTDIQFSAVIT